MVEKRNKKEQQPQPSANKAADIDSEITKELIKLRVAGDQAHGAYEHEKAVEYYSQALEVEGIPHELEYELRSGRAECFRFLGNNERQEKDLALRCISRRGIWI